MSITNKTRKILWARSGNRCALCKKELVRLEDEVIKQCLVLGEECHLVSKKPNGPRYNSNVNIDHDGHDNLILLCRDHHTIIDEQLGEYTIEYLKSIKLQHEQWVTETLGAKDTDLNTGNNGKHDLVVLNKIAIGKQLTDILDGCDAYQFDHDILNTADVVELTGKFFDLCYDYVEGWDVLMPSGRVRYGFEISGEIEILRSEGLVLFGKKGRVKVHSKDLVDENKNVSVYMSVTCLFIAHPDNPFIVNDDYFVAYYPRKINFC